MRLHTDTLRASHVRDALIAEQAAGRIARTVTFRTLVEHGSRSHATAIEVQLTSYDKEPGDGRRRGNDGSYGAMADDYAATYDEWGWLIAAVYAQDADAVWGSVKNPYYANRFDFDRKTALSYNPAALIALLEAGDTDPYPMVQKGAHGAKSGRVGAARLNDEQHDHLASYWGGEAPWALYRPRTVADIERFARLAPVTA